MIQASGANGCSHRSEGGAGSGDFMPRFACLDWNVPAGLGACLLGLVNLCPKPPFVGRSPLALLRYPPCPMVSQLRPMALMYARPFAAFMERRNISCQIDLLDNLLKTPTQAGSPPQCGNGFRNRATHLILPYSSNGFAELEATMVNSS
jgi:hypothetical protein